MPASLVSGESSFLGFQIAASWLCPHLAFPQCVQVERKRKQAPWCSSALIPSDHGPLSWPHLTLIISQRPIFKHHYIGVRASIYDRELGCVCVWGNSVHYNMLEHFCHTNEYNEIGWLLLIILDKVLRVLKCITNLFNYLSLSFLLDLYSSWLTSLLGKLISWVAEGTPQPRLALFWHVSF